MENEGLQFARMNDGVGELDKAFGNHKKDAMAESDVNSNVVTE